MLDLHVQDFLESLLPQEEFLKIKERPFYDRVERIKQCLREVDCTLTNKAEFEQFFHRLDPLRETRNHIAHGILRFDQKNRNPDAVHSKRFGWFQPNGSAAFGIC